METKATLIDLKSKRAEIFLTYRQELDDTSLIILTVLSDQQKSVFDEQNEKIDRAVDKINATRRSLDLDKEHPHWQAFWFGFGKFGLSFLFTAILVFILVLHYQTYQQKRDMLSSKCYWFERFYQYTIDSTNLNRKLKNYINNHPLP